MYFSPRLTRICLPLFLATAAAHATVPSGLVHHWNFDEGPDWHDSAFQSASTNITAADVVGDATASLQNMGASNWISGRQFTALAFDGVNEHLVVATNLAATLGNTASLSFWLRTTQTGAVSAATAPGIAGVAGTGGAQWGWLDDAGRIGLAVDNTLVARSTNSVSDGQWHHVVLTRNSASGAGQVYLDGVLQHSATGASGARATAFTSLARIEIGGSPKYFQGRLDQIHIFNRVISAAEVSMLHTNHAPKCWDITTEGVNGRPFSTASIFTRTYDVERDPVSVWSWTQPAHGSVTHNGDGSFAYTATGGYVGADSFAVTVEDGKGGFHTANLKVAVFSEPPGGGGVPVTQFTDLAPVQANGTNINFGNIRVPRVIDWDQDGRLDLLIGAGGSVWRYMNTGTTSAPVFAAGVKVQAAGVDINIGSSSLPITLSDMTGDGVKDLVLTDTSNKLRVYRNTAASNAAPVYAAYVFVKHTNGTDFVAADQRFDLGDWNGDGKPDLVTGTGSGNVQLFLNTGTAADPRFSTGTTLFSGSYNLYPRLFDLSGNGPLDLIRGINWGDIVYWRDPGSRGLVNGATFNITYGDGSSPGMQSLVNGAVVDFGDFNGDGLPDLVMGGQGGSGNMFLTRGVLKTVAESIAEIEAIYDVDTNAVGVTLSANTNALLTELNNANWNLISRIQNGTLGTREALWAALTNHIARYGFLKYQNLNTTNFHHVPSIVLQNWVMLQYALADTPTRRTNIADVMGLTGTLRTLYLETGLGLGDNGLSLPATYGTIRDFQRRHPRELFPDAIITTDQLYGDGRGGFIWTPNSTKNTFGQWALGSANEWAGDLTTAINKELGAGAATGEYFTFVMGHEVTHSLDGYVNSRANTDLRKRWGLMLCTAAGPDVIPGTDGWRSVANTKTNFQAKGYWDGNDANWSAAWTAYWTNGPGTPFRNTSFMRGSIDWFLDNSQESLATQANHHWANGPGRLVGAVDRFRRASGAGLGPLKANINEVATFIDFLSAGMNRVNLVETKYQASPQQVNWFDHYADLERDDRGYIRSLKVDGRTYLFEANTNGVVTNVITSGLLPPDDVLMNGSEPSTAYNRFWAWMKADNTNSPNGAGADTNGAVVTRWDDVRGAFDHDLARNSSGGGGIFYTNRINGYPAINYNGTRNNWGANTVAGEFQTMTNGYTLILVARVTGPVPAIGYLFDGSSGAGRVGLRAVAGSPATWQLHAFRNAAPAVNTTAVTTNVTTNVWQVHAVQVSGTTMSHYLNGALAGSGTFADGGTPLGMNGLILNCNASVASHLGCDIAEVLAYTETLSTGDRNAVENYLLAKYALVLPPPSAPVTTPFVVGTNLQLQIASQSGYNYVVQAATNLVPPVVWSNVSTNAGTGGTLNLAVPINPATPQRFFRVWAY